MRGDVVVVSRDELRSIVRDAVREALGDRTEREWLTREQAAEHLGVSTKTISHYVERGTLKAHKLGRLLRFRREDLDAFESPSSIRKGRRGG